MSVDESAESVTAEYEDARTINWLRSTLGRSGVVVDLPWGPDFNERLAGDRIDVIFNITEGTGGRNRESLVPAIAESRGIPYTGSDALALGLSLHKGYAKTLAAAAGVPCPRGHTYSPSAAGEHAMQKMNMPVIVKPTTGGSSMGITADSKAGSIEELEKAIIAAQRAGSGDILIEQFIAGREFAVALLNKGDGPEVLPLAEIVLNGGDPEAFYSIDKKSVHDKQVLCPADVEPSMADLFSEYGMRVFDALGCRDFARVDFRLSEDGTPYFLEINPLPGLSPFYGIYPVQAEAGGVSAEDLVRILINNALSRS